jgi:DNA-binding transcriptional ArsR family regulator
MMTAFEALAEPHRRQILDLLRHRERPVGELVGALAVSQPAVSKHLRVLRDVGLVEARVAAQQRLYRVRAQPIKEIDDWIAPYRALWSSSLDTLEHHLDRMDAARHDHRNEQGGDHREQ